MSEWKIDSPSIYRASWAETLGSILPVCIILLVSTCLGLFRLGYQSIWLDEYTTLTVSASLESILNFTRAHPEQQPLYYFLVYLTGSFESLYKARLLSLIFGVASIIPLFYIGRKVASERTALLACILFSLSPFILYYNQEGRMYTLVMLLVLCQTAFFVKWIEDFSRASRIGYFLFSVAALYTHLLSIFVLAIELLYVIMVCFRSKRLGIIREHVLLLLGIGMCYLPWLLFTIPYIRNESQGWKDFHNILFALPYTFFRFAFGYAVFPLNADVKLNFGKHVYQALGWFSILLFAYAPSFFLFLKSRSRNIGGHTLILMLALLPVLMMTVLSLFKNIVSERYVIYASPFFYMLPALSAYEHLPRNKWLVRVSYLLPLFVCILGLFSYYSNPNFGKIEYKSASQYIMEKASHDAVILVRPGFTKGMIDHYLQGARETYPFEKWKPSVKSQEVWIVEQMMDSSFPTNISNWNYEEVREKVWPQEVGLRLSEWHLKEMQSTEPTGRN